jgi:NADPH:quinone reductase-like Zn-dependent oxidoreductase
VAFVEQHDVHPVIDRVFAFEQAPAAFEHMAHGDCTGRIVIHVP